MNDSSLAQVRCVMFDLDGTLVDSAPDIALSMNKMLQQLSHPPRELAQVRDWMGNGAGRLIKRALTGQVDGEPPEQLFKQAQQLFFEIYEQHINVASTMYPGALEGLTILHEQSYTLACVTMFEHLICGDDLSVKKPDPRVLQTILKKNQLSPLQAVMVGDSASDIKAAQSANMKSFCVSYGYHQGYLSGKGVDALGADYIIDSIAELPQYLLH